MVEVLVQAADMVCSWIQPSQAINNQYGSSKCGAGSWLMCLETADDSPPCGLVEVLSHMLLMTLPVQSSTWSCIRSPFLYESHDALQLSSWGKLPLS